MKTRRTASAVIWSTVVCAGAMLGCSTATPAPATPDPCADPCAAMHAQEVEEEEEAPVEVVPVPVAVAEPDPEPEPGPEPEPVAAPTTVMITVTSTPAGATVHVGDDAEARGKTPMTLELAISDAAQPIKLSRSGYTTKTVKVVPAHDGEVAVTLSKRTKQPKQPEPRPRGRGEGGTGRGFILS